MGRRIANWHTPLNVTPEEYCAKVGHKPKRQGGEVYCATCYATLPDDTPVETPGKHFFVLRDGKLVEITKDERKSMEFKKLRRIDPFQPAVGMEDLITECREGYKQEQRERGR